MRATLKGWVALAVLITALTACGGGDSGEPYVEPKGPAVKTLNVDSGNVFFEPTELESPPGIVGIRLENIESGTHDLVIRDIPGFQLEVSGKGDTSSGKVRLSAKEWEFYCTIPGHKEAGMKGTITVR